MTREQDGVRLSLRRFHHRLLELSSDFLSIYKKLETNLNDRYIPKPRVSSRREFNIHTSQLLLFDSLISSLFSPSTLF